MNAILIFIILAIVYFVFIKPKVNPPIKPIPKKIYDFNKMAIFTANGELEAQDGYTEVYIFNNVIVFNGQINDICSIEKISNEKQGVFYFCIGKGDTPIIVEDEFLEEQIHYYFSENIGYRLFN